MKIYRKPQDVKQSLHLPVDFVATKHEFTDTQNKQVEYMVLSCTINGKEILFKPCVGHNQTALAEIFGKE